MTSSRAQRAAAVPLMFLGGALVAGQSQINGRLAHELGDGPRAGLAAASVSFGSGLVVVCIIAALMPSARAGARRFLEARRSGELPWIWTLGGLLGAFLVATQGFTIASIGVALFSVAVTAGQATSGLLVDHLGIGPSGKQHLTPPRLVAALFAVVAVLLAAGERLVDQFSLTTAGLALLPLVAGAGAALQQGMNGRVSHVGGPWVTTVNNFVVGTSALLVVLVLSLLVPGQLDGLPGTWWMYLGGVMGVGFISLAALLVRVHGVLVLGLCMIAGQIITAEIIELLSDDPHVGVLGIVAGLLTVVGVAVALLIRPRQPAATATAAG
ncbi:hypothetical protein ASD11_06740 [Aeromicrobium sp. Root495]|uniref:DMT family transporter n=1 Tax=Aeromicrobium sp. Root495 TaxID=1736550 RepID=UPI0006FA2D6B|nr:DMT family transporter [Aeromicrobium sp. Root495]KQY59269.1 hypothetical protein ASD11_06740 [Aeromicrobium sp. Root495]